MLTKLVKNKELRLVVTTQVIQLAGTLGFTKVLAVYLGKEAYGFYALIMSIVTLISMVPYTAFDEGAARYLSVYEDKGIIPQRLVNIPVLYGLIYFIYIVTGAIIYPFVIDEWQILLLPVLALTLLEVLKNTFLKFENNRRNRGFVTYSKIFEFSVKIAATFLLAQWFDLSVLKILLLLILIDLSIGVAEYVIRRTDYRISSISSTNLKSTAKDLFNFSWPLIIWSVFAWFQNMSNRWIIDLLMDKEAVAEFSILSSISLLPSTAITGVLGAFLLPIIYEKTNNDPKFAWATIKKITPFQFALYTALIFGSVLFSSQIVSLLSSSKYQDAAWMLPYMMLGTSLFAIVQVSTYEIFALKATKKLILSTIIPGASSVVCGYFLIKYFQLQGAMYNFIITYFLYAILTFFIVVRFHAKNQNLNLKSKA